MKGPFLGEINPKAHMWVTLSDGHNLLSSNVTFFKKDALEYELFWIKIKMQMLKKRMFELKTCLKGELSKGVR